MTFTLMERPHVPGETLYYHHYSNEDVLKTLVSITTGVSPEESILYVEQHSVEEGYFKDVGSEYATVHHECITSYDLPSDSGKVFVKVSRCTLVTPERERPELLFKIDGIHDW